MKLISPERPPTHPPPSFLPFSDRKREFSPRRSCQIPRKTTFGHPASSLFFYEHYIGGEGSRTYLVFALFYSRLGHRIDGRESGDQVQMRSFMPRLQKLEELCVAAAVAAAAQAGSQGGGGAPSRADNSQAASLLRSAAGREGGRGQAESNRMEPSRADNSQLACLLRTAGRQGGKEGRGRGAEWSRVEPTTASLPYARDSSLMISPPKCLYLTNK